MAIKIIGTTYEAEVDSNNALRTVVYPRGQHYANSILTGTVAAGLTSGSAIWVMRLDPAATVAAYFTRLRLQYTTLVAYTTPVTAARRLELYRGSGAAASGGTAVASQPKKDTGNANSEFDAAGGGDVRYSNAALTVAGITFETTPLAEFGLSHVGAAGGFQLFDKEWDSAQGGPMELQPGELLAIRAGATFDAAGTWQAIIDAEWFEA
jgi:hypothetical protein